MRILQQILTFGGTAIWLVYWFWAITNDAGLYEYAVKWQNEFLGNTPKPITSGIGCALGIIAVHYMFAWMHKTPKG